MAAPEFVALSIGTISVTHNLADDHPIGAHAHRPADQVGPVDAANVFGVGFPRLVGDHLVAILFEPIERQPVNDTLSPEMVQVLSLDRDARVRAALVPPTADGKPRLNDPRSRQSQGSARALRVDQRLGRQFVGMSPSLARHALPCRSVLHEELLHGCCTQKRYKPGSRRSAAPTGPSSHVIGPR
jgi:hypothetical protein